MNDALDAAIEANGETALTFLEALVRAPRPIVIRCWPPHPGRAI
jgi:hypothetical protein